MNSNESAELLGNVSALRQRGTLPGGRPSWAVVSDSLGTIIASVPPHLAQWAASELQAASPETWRDVLAAVRAELRVKCA
jgi:hypothetical protein